jgi:NADPH-dependent glutamate synthase beta subunit-like oxidoreductase/ferredoxin
VKSIVIYFSQTGNTKKVAEAIYSGIRSTTGECEIVAQRDVDARRLTEFDLIGLGSPVHRLTIPASFRVFEDGLPTMEGKHCFLFATHGPNPGMIFRGMGVLLLQKGMTLIGYHSWYGDDWMPVAPKPYFTDGHPDSLDLREAANFGREMVERSLRISRGEREELPDILSIKEQIFPAGPPTEIKLNKEKCRYPICRLCIDNCPQGCIDLSPEAMSFVNLEKCAQCWFCELICPTGAIEVDWDPMAEQFKKGTLAALPLLKKAEARGHFRSLVDKVDIDTPWYKVSQRPRFVIEASPCVLACPIHVNVPGYQNLVIEGKFIEAYQQIRRSNPLPAVCGHVCYHPCEDACKRRHVDQPIAVACLERLVTDQVDIGEIEPPRVRKDDRKVAVIGSGPAGLAAAHDLALFGYRVTVFEALPEPGGMLRMGIPEYRLPKQVVEKEVGYITRLGVEIKTGIRIGEQVQIENLRRDYQAVFIATGAQESVMLGIRGEENRRVILGIEFLRSVNTGVNIEMGNRVVVIGGGNVAIDAARVARRLGGSVTIIYHRSRAEMPASSAEVNAAEEEGVEFVFLATPTAIVSQDGKTLSMECTRMTLGAADASGRKRPIPVLGAEFTIEVDSVITAVGQKPSLEFIKGIGLKVSSEGKLVVDDATLATSIEGIFAGGDATTGSASVVTAIAAGKRGARSIDNFLRGIPLWVGQTGSRPSRCELTEEDRRLLREKVSAQKRVLQRESPPEERIKDFALAAMGFSLAQGQEEAMRCLKCDWKA